ncbi:(2,3-dihydroxybenzoyl)adenylate synthase [Desulfoscipio gibsoniae]|uniref:Peptide arylation enzyme n=1 Tax=Desulfoscipio gibsoniae DSM 7213 TaxID=767817 RepID=R4KBY1_9FIRM|nr:AMP-binding protein [Desulfoscipio gibsoniae]AGL00064.1 peptide arylation enzyme [Desulfoscipio gibsoniae DSM 7213]
MLQGCVPWPEEYAKYYREQGYWEDKTLSEVLDLSINKHGSKEALVFNKMRLSYTQLGEIIDRLAYQFLQIGLKPLDRVVIQLPNGPEFIYSYFALIKIGVIPILALAPHRKGEISHFIKFSGTVGYIIPDIYRKFNYIAMAREIKNLNQKLKYVFVSGSSPSEFISLNKLLEAPIDKKEIQETLAKYRPDPDEVALMVLSGGTTALPKMIPRTHNDYVCITKYASRVGRFDEHTRMLVTLPIAHNYMVCSPGFQGVLFSGGKVVISPGTDINTIFSLVEKEQITFLSVAPPIITNWLKSNILSHYNYSSIKVVQTGGARLAPELRAQVRERFGCFVMESYGSGEGVLNMVRLDASEHAILNSSGKPVCPADETKIIDENGNELPDGETGELLIRGPYTIRGYYNSPALNAVAFTPDGFYRMGDRCRKDKDGYIYFESRIKELINRGGEKISCEEIETLIFAHPKVKAVCLVAVPDEVYGEKACACVQLNPGEELSFEELIKFLMTCNLAKFKLPEKLLIIDEFPMTASGKVLKRKLKEIAVEQSN